MTIGELKSTLFSCGMSVSKFSVYMGYNRTYFSTRSDDELLTADMLKDALSVVKFFKHQNKEKQLFITKMQNKRAYSAYKEFDVERMYRRLMRDIERYSILNEYEY